MEEVQHFEGRLEGEPLTVKIHPGYPGIRRKGSGKGETDMRIRELLRDHPRGITVEEAGRALSLSRSAAARRLDALARAGSLEVETYGRTRVYTLPRKGNLASVLRRPAPLLLILSPDLRVTGANDPFLSLFGQRKGDLVGRKITRAPLGRIFGDRVLGEIRKGPGEMADPLEFECLAGDARYIFRAVLTPLSGPRGPAGMVLSLEDVTGTVLHRRRIGELMDGGTLALLTSNPRILDDMLHRREEEERLRLIRSSVDQAGAAMLWIGKDGRILRANPAALSLLGRREEELGRMTFSGLGPDMPPETWDALWGALEIRPEAAFETSFRTGEGAAVPVEIRASRFRHGDQELGLVVAMDISRLKEREAALRGSEEALRGSESALQGANRRLNLFAALTRHDALNDIAALGMYLALLEQGDGTAGDTGVTGKMAAVLGSLRRRLEFTRDYAGLGEAASGWEDLAGAVRKGIFPVDTGHLRVDLDLPALEIYRDSLFGRAMANLVDNTLRHGEHATSLRFHARVEYGACTLLVEDDGTGIPPGNKEAIFRPGFGRNTGLGLFLVREILGITGMEIRETGEPGQGARFEIRIPRGGFRKKDGPGIAPAEPAGPGMVPGPFAGSGRAVTQ